MPIRIEHGPATLVGRLAAEAGLAVGRTRGRERRESRDMQLTQMMLAAQERGADQAAARAARDQAFNLQRSLAARVARQRPVKPQARDQRETMRKAVDEAVQSGIYTPRQITQMKIMSNMGDFGGVQSILRSTPEKPPKPVVVPSTLQERELKRQTGVIKTVAERGITAIQEKLSTLDERRTKLLSDRYDTPESRAFVEENPQFMPEALRTQLQKIDVARQPLQEQMEGIKQQAGLRTGLLNLGMTIEQQLDREAKQRAEARKIAERQQDRAGVLSDTQKMGISVIRGKFTRMSKILEAENTRLSAEVPPFKDETPEDHAKRITPIMGQMDLNQKQLFSLFAQEKKEIGQFLQSFAPKQAQSTITDKQGRRWELVRYDANGQPMYREVK